MTIVEGLIYPPGWERQGQEVEDFAKELVQSAGMQFADIAIKWGMRYAQKSHHAIFRTKLWGIEPHITIIANAKPEKQALLVRKKDQEGLGTVNLMGRETLMLPLQEGQSLEQTPSGLLKVVRKEAGQMEWDINLTIQEAVEIIDKIDNEAKNRGLYDPDKKQRKPLPEPVYIPMPKLRVEEVFSEVGVSNPLLGEDPNDLLEQFDHPEELVVRNDPYTGEPFALVHKRDAEYLDKREQVVNDVFIEKGVNYQELLEGLVKNPDIFEPIDLEIRKEVERRTQNLLKAESLKRLPPREDPGAEATITALIAFYEGRVFEGKRIFEELMVKFPGSSYIPHEYAVVIIHMENDLKAALPLFVKSTEREPKKALHFYHTAKCAARLELYEEAVEWLEKTKQQNDYGEFMEESREDIDGLIKGLGELIRKSKSAQNY